MGGEGAVRFDGEVLKLLILLLLGGYDGGHGEVVVRLLQKCTVRVHREVVEDTLSLRGHIGLDDEADLALLLLRGRVRVNGKV